MKQFALFLFLTTYSLFGQNSAKTCEILTNITTLIQKEHYQPKPIDDSLSVYVFDMFLDDLDSNRNLFTKKEYDKLCKHRLLLDNYILEHDCTFINDFVATYQFALERKKKTLEKIQKVDFDYQTKDTVQFSKKNFPFDLLETDVEKRWVKRMKYDILEDISKISSNLDSLNQNFLKLEKTSKAKIFESNLCKVSGLLNSSKGIEYDLQNNFLNIFCTYFDPHTNYFSLDEKTNFMSSLSTTGYSLGLNVTLNDKEEILIADIVPGSPAAFSKKFEKGDVILKISNKKGEDFLVSCTSLEKLGELIYSDSNKEIELTIQKKNGTIISVLLKKQIMKTVANTVYSFIAEKETRIGYINIPSFYSDFEGIDGKGSAYDVVVELAKLKKDDIQGMVIDLQDNGGGSMVEAVKLAGLFIDFGPVSILVDNKKKQTVLKDYIHGIAYNGPIVVLTNGNSASASEFFAAALQDYNRAIVIGSTTLGKATMQSIIPLDKNQQEFVKLTIEKFYRITGESNQIKGIKPDVSLPILFDSIIPRERSFKTALKYDEINSKTKFNPFPKAYFQKAVELSNLRTKNNTRFNEIIAINKEINTIYNSQKKMLIMTFENVFNDIHAIDSLWKKIKNNTTILTNCTIVNNSYDSEKIKSDAFQQEINSSKINELKTNPYLAEAITILNDFNVLNK
ncbi:carboxy terminal-processing peptidase [Flavobacterium cellulosilyticum]|uniref:Peptidase S41 n=1 Tax=Flavobacterium cellulosilyticum TaxID=2541731 RepID=A0A4R5CIA5_9FLAO|nr:carboxy terminal-processing peptidase [Flavobacterium cellulosilyticum]TDD97064.1 peptidase S41 [Flavobacterium cellulosilyticum]